MYPSRKRRILPDRTAMLRTDRRGM
jgi:hypothetical protein